MKVIRQAKDLTAFYSIQMEQDVLTSNQTSPHSFRGASTSRELSKIVAKYVPVTLTDVHDLLTGDLSEELHYFLCKKLDVSNIDLGSAPYLPEYSELLEDLSIYLNITE